MTTQAGVRAESLTGLEKATRDEAGAAERLADALDGSRETLSSLDAAALQRAMQGVRASAEALQQAGNARTALTRLAARALGLPEGATLADVLGRVSGDAGPLAEASRALTRALDRAGRSAAAQTLAARYGAGLWAHRLGLLGGAVGGAAYGPCGRLQPTAVRAGRCA